MAVSPVRPPSRIPDADSMKAAIGDVPMRLPSTLLMPSTQKAKVCLGNSFFSFTKPAQVQVPCVSACLGRILHGKLVRQMWETNPTITCSSRAPSPQIANYHADTVQYVTITTAWKGITSDGESMHDGLAKQEVGLQSHPEHNC